MKSKKGATKEKKAHVWERDEYDWYVEPRAAADALFRVELFHGIIHDPCCGKGNIVRAAASAGYVASGSDIVNRHPVDPPWFVGERDFLRDIAALHQRINVVMNPPFYRAAGAEAFIRKALALCDRKVAAFVDVRFLSGKDRAEGLFSEFPPERVWMLYPRVSCPPGAYLESGGKAEGGSADWCWIVWPEQTRRKSGHYTQLDWLNVKKQRS